MNSRNLLPYETIKRVTEGEPEAMQPPQSPALTFLGLEIKLHQRRVLKNGTDIPLTRLEYGALCYLAASPGRALPGNDNRITAAHQRQPKTGNKSFLFSVKTRKEIPGNFARFALPCVVSNRGALGGRVISLWTKSSWYFGR